eukprot:2101253-Amphidinium_carterae.2
MVHFDSQSTGLAGTLVVARSARLQSGVRAVAQRHLCTSLPRLRPACGAAAGVFLALVNQRSQNGVRDLDVPPLSCCLVSFLTDVVAAM